MITLRANIPAVVASLDRVATQLRFAAAVALNETAKRAQEAVHARVRQQFTIREGQFFQPRYLARIEHFATKTEPWVKLALPTGSGLSGRLLAPFETGEPKVDPTGQRLAVPQPALRPTKTSRIARSLYPAALRLVPRRHVGRGEASILPARTRVTARGKRQWVGKLGTFLLDPTEHGVKRRIILQRTGPGKRDVRLLWVFVPQVRRPPVLQWYATLTTAFNRAWEPEFGRALARALATAR